MNNNSVMVNFRITSFLLLPLILFMAGVSDAQAQRFSVASFRQLPNDVSAFINPVRDLNDEDCGLVKVIASEDFAFSTPLGIVKRVDHVGEIWLYLPQRSRKITVKHPRWGVLRDYQFPARIDSHMTYEMRIDEPQAPVAVSEAAPQVTTVIDTLVVTRVDTLVVAPHKKPVPLNMALLGTVGTGGSPNHVMGGVMAMVMKRHGAFVHVATDFGSIGSTVGECDKDGMMKGHMPFYSGRTRKSAFMVNAGASHRLSRRVAVFEGIGYSTTSLAWELAPSEGGGYVRNSHYCVSGVSFEAGVLFRNKRIALSASVSSLKGTEWYGWIGVGITLGKRK